MNTSILDWTLAALAVSLIGCESSATPQAEPIPAAQTESLPQEDIHDAIPPTASSTKEIVQSEAFEPEHDESESSETAAETNLPDMKKLIDHFLFYPKKFPVGNWEPKDLEVEEAWFDTVDGSKLNGWYCPVPNAEATLFYAHGNGGNLSYRAARIRELQQRWKCNVFIYDYRGYGRSEGVPTATGILEDSDAALEWLKTKTGLEAKEMIILGRSLGGAVAADLAHRHGAKALILESTFFSLREISGNYVPKTLAKLLVADRLNTAGVLTELKCPVIISHGTIDHVVPYSHGVRLSELAREPKLFLEFPQFDHNDSPPEWYYEKVTGFLVPQFAKP